MNTLTATAQLISIILNCVYEYKNKSLSVFLWAVLLVMFGIPHFISVVFSITEYSEDILIKASFFVLLFNTMYIISKIVIRSIFNYSYINKYTSVKKLKNPKKVEPSGKKDRFLMNVFFIQLGLSFFILMVFIFRNLGGISQASWGRLYTLNTELGFRSAIRYSNLIFFASAGVILVLKDYSKRVKFLLALIIALLYSFITGNRITILPVLVAFIIPFIYNENSRITMKKALFFSILGFLAVYLVYGLRLLRIYGGMYNFFINFNLGQVNAQILDMMMNGDGELGLRKVFYYFIDMNNQFPNFNSAHTYIRLLLIAVPTSLSFGLKPPDFAISMGSAWLGNFSNTAYSTHPTLYGDVFANLWWFGILLAVFWAIVTYLIDIYVNRKNNVIRKMLLVLFGSVYIIIGRGSVYNAFFIGYSGSIIIGLTYFVTKFKVKL
ncbi:MAG: hypothetical protein PWR27_2344 [Petroclostridium sp.]|nr:hypothetical protein [Petroclostridium sp.]